MFGFRTKLAHWTARRRLLRRWPSARPFTLAELGGQSLTRDEQYGYCVCYFDRFLPPELRAHRRYFASAGRGFGEDAFHAMWFLLFQALRPASALEIGVYRGQTVTLWAMLARQLGFACHVGCISPFTPAGDTVSRYRTGLDYLQDMLHHHRHFNLPAPEVCRHLSSDPEAEVFARGRQWDCIYIDGCHDYEIAQRDWHLCAMVVAPGGIIVLDDAALGTDFHPPAFASQGHPGPSRIAAEVDPARFREILAVGHNRVFQRVA